MDDWKIGPVSEHDCEVALALGQDEDVVRKVKAGQMHPVMLAFGLWKDEPEFDTLVEEIYANRRRQGSRPARNWAD